MSEEHPKEKWKRKIDEIAMSIPDWEKRKIDEIAMSIPDWEEHWRDYKERHPEESMPEVFKKASFTRRMMIAKKVKAFVRELFEEELKNEL